MLKDTMGIAAQIQTAAHMMVTKLDSKKESSLKSSRDHERSKASTMSWTGVASKRTNNLTTYQNMKEKTRHIHPSVRYPQSMSFSDLA